MALAQTPAIGTTDVTFAAEPKEANLELDVRCQTSPGSYSARRQLESRGRRRAADARIVRSTCWARRHVEQRAQARCDPTAPGAGIDECPPVDFVESIRVAYVTQRFEARTLVAPA